MQHTEQENTEQNTDTETNNHAENSTQDSTQPQRTEHSTYDLHTYSFDFYCLRVYIKKHYIQTIDKLYTLIY